MVLWFKNSYKEHSIFLYLYSCSCMLSYFSRIRFLATEQEGKKKTKSSDEQVALKEEKA